MASQCLQRKARRMTRSSVESVRLRVFIRGTTQLATVDTNTKRTAMTARSTLISFPRRVLAVAFSRPSSCTTCCCCCCSSILEILVWHASSASCRSRTEVDLKYAGDTKTRAGEMNTLMGFNASSWLIRLKDLTQLQGRMTLIVSGNHFGQ